jgi:hypothetical protein
MGWLFKSKRVPPAIKTRIGTFSYDGTNWTALIGAQNLILLWTETEFNADVVERAEEVLKQDDALSHRALNFLRQQKDLWDQKTTLSLESVDITELLNDRFSMAFAVEGCPDLILTVEFENGEPKGAWGAD